MWSFAISFPWLVYFEVIPVEGVGDYDLADQAETFQVRREMKEDILFPELSARLDGFMSLLLLLLLPSAVHHLLVCFRGTFQSYLSLFLSVSPNITNEILNGIAFILERTNIIITALCVCVVCVCVLLT